MRTNQNLLLVVAFLGVMAIVRVDAQQSEFRAPIMSNPEEVAVLNVVALRIAAYNAHNIESFVTAHAENVQIYEFPEKKVGEGRAHLKRIFEPQFARGAGLIQVKGQFVIGDKVVSQELVTVDNVSERIIAIYTVENGVIHSVRLIESED